MPFNCHHLDKWEFTNLDLAEEVLESKKRCVICIGGASSSGKSFCAKNLKRVLEANGHHTLIVSTDNYNKGISGIITDKVNEKVFHGKLPDRDALVKEIKSVLIDTPFENKFDSKSSDAIRQRIKRFLAPEDLDLFITGCQQEIKHLNFDEPTVYDLDAVARDIKGLLAGQRVNRRRYSKMASEQTRSRGWDDGSRYEVFVIEGIYVLSNHLLDHLDRAAMVTDFIEGSPKSLFLRRIIRDARTTSSPTYYTIAMYFNNIVPSYNQTILPSAVNADIIFKNDMTSEELREGNLYLTKDRVRVTNPVFLQKLLDKATITSTAFQKDIYLIGKDEPSDFNNLLRLREISTDQGRTYVPSSLVHKGAPKARKDGKMIRPINILLREGEFAKVFTDEGDFIRKAAEAGFAVDRTVSKVKRRISYEGYRLSVSDFRGEGVWLEFADPDLPQPLRNRFVAEAAE